MLFSPSCLYQVYQTDVYSEAILYLLVYLHVNTGKAKYSFHLLEEFEKGVLNFIGKLSVFVYSWFSFNSFF